MSQNTCPLDSSPCLNLLITETFREGTDRGDNIGDFIKSWGNTHSDKPLPGSPTSALVKIRYKEIRCVLWTFPFIAMEANEW